MSYDTVNPQNLRPGDRIRPTGAAWPERMLDKIFTISHLEAGSGSPIFIEPEANDGGGGTWVADVGRSWAVEVVERAPLDIRPGSTSPAAVTTKINPALIGRPEPVIPQTPADEFGEQVDRILSELGKTLKAKNAAYGDSALNPVRIFSSASTTEQIRVRLDDKLSRLARGSAAGEDVITDLMGYLVLLRIADSREAE